VFLLPNSLRAQFAPFTMVKYVCWRCGIHVKTGASRCSFESSGGPPSNWDRYANSLPITVPSQETHPREMVPFGRTPSGASCQQYAHSQCYRLLLGVKSAAQLDPDRAAAFEAAHPTERHTRQAAAAGIPAPVVHTLPAVGTSKQRMAPDAV
jgi:hypothetical protein